MGFGAAKRHPPTTSRANDMRMTVRVAVVRNMVGHRSNCVSVDFHPYGDFFASGSSDTNLKV